MSSDMKRIENNINDYAKNLLTDFLHKKGINNDDILITPFKIKMRQQHKGKGLISANFDQRKQARDFEAWSSPGNFVLNFI